MGATPCPFTRSFVPPEAPWGMLSVTVPRGRGQVYLRRRGTASPSVIGSAPADCCRGAKIRVRRHANGDEDIAGRAAPRAGFAVAANADLLPVLDAGGNLHGQGFRFSLRALDGIWTSPPETAVVKGISSSCTRSAPARAGGGRFSRFAGGAAELAEDVAQPARRSCPKRSPRNWLKSMSSGAEAAGARSRPGPRRRRATNSRRKPPCGPPAPIVSNQLPVAIVHLPFFGIIQHVESSLNLLKLFFGRLVVGVHVGVIFPRQLAIGLLDIRLRGVFDTPRVL